MVVGSGGEIMAGRGWSRMVADGHGWSHDLVMPLGNKMVKKLQKPRPKLKNYVYYIFTENICSACSPVQVVVFWKKCNNIVERRFKVSHFEGSIIP